MAIATPGPPLALPGTLTPTLAPNSAAVEAAARSLAEDAGARLGATPVPADPTQRAVLAVDIHDVFLQRDEAGRLTVVDPGPDAVADAVARAGGRA